MRGARAAYQLRVRMPEEIRNALYKASDKSFVSLQDYVLNSLTEKLKSDGHLSSKAFEKA